MKPKQIGLLFTLAPWPIIIALIMAPWPWKVAIAFTSLFAANIAFFRAVYIMTWRKAFNECALGWVTIGLFILAIAELTN